MKVIPMRDYPQDVADNFLSGINFVREMRLNDPAQFALLMDRTQFIELSQEEAIINAGEMDSRYFFLLKGQLSVYADNAHRDRELNKITPGQSFGALSIICHQPRTATVAVTPGCTGALLIAIDLAGLGELLDFSVFNLTTKLSLYRTVVNNTRWQLEVYRMDFPAHPLTQKSKEVEIFIGKKLTEQELQSLERQIMQLTALISEWNHELIVREPAPQDRGAAI
ncbi:MAG: cyclic nucleotide-binding domain-containing protein [Cellvibrionales bacterium]|jgi:CRP/FNR family cyclic AMP-dependent transcriptional regulator|nr:cyclic nucleotide-binding domain-containing protein [Cellvibrionales bacterium]MBK8675719.1 cyclic nucleotide-binding domain-containing protein [Cellvibrionales bacterium]MCC7517531.1 cyclic nucleotide-binding domain-containing protein [Pseudomonadales bacterium]HRF87668.1 cyclic nucleotide-binding domain-containing protein [Pseudomonadales bacterium]HRG50513.1 cyclic nucleotide-binding domain-containing protein [Pseudomonadales bacterium]